MAYEGPEREKETVLHRRDLLHNELVARSADLVTPDVMVNRMSTEAAYDEILLKWRLLDEAGVTAVVRADDLRAYGFVSAAHEMVLTILDGLTIASFSNLPYSGTVSPGLASVDLSARELGTRAIGARRCLLETQTVPMSTSQ